MPLVKIDLIKGARTPEEIRKIADVTQDVLIEKFAAPKRVRYQIITQHEPYEMICQDTGLGIERSDKLLFVHVFQQGRKKDQKEALYAGLAEQLGKQCGVRGEDLIISLSENTKEDWSFGFGRAQFNTGEL
ncbi:hypothetical protein LTR66_016127 [Elasticomyces elasticus]|nr:hypothetical protein LTR66_016127 [Elasticomyces elasticus]